MNNTSFDGLDELYHHAKFGEDFCCFLLLVMLRDQSTVLSRGA